MTIEQLQAIAIIRMVCGGGFVHHCPSYSEVFQDFFFSLEMPTNRGELLSLKHYQLVKKMPFLCKYFTNLIDWNNFRNMIVCRFIIYGRGGSCLCCMQVNFICSAGEAFSRLSTNIHTLFKLFIHSSIHTIHESHLQSAIECEFNGYCTFSMVFVLQIQPLEYAKPYTPKWIEMYCIGLLNNAATSYKKSPFVGITFV